MKEGRMLCDLCSLELVLTILFMDSEGQKGTHFITPWISTLGLTPGIKLDQMKYKASSYTEAELLWIDWKSLLGKQHLNRTFFFFLINKSSTSVMAVYPIPVCAG